MYCILKNCIKVLFYVIIKHLLYKINIKAQQPFLQIFIMMQSLEFSNFLHNNSI